MDRCIEWEMQWSANMVQTSIHCDLNSIFQNYSSNESNLLKLLHFLYEEICFDKLQMALIQTKYYKALNKKRQNDLKVSSALLSKQSMLNSSFTLKQYTNVNESIDQSFQLAIQNCFFNFNEIEETRQDKPIRVPLF